MKNLDITVTDNFMHKFVSVFLLFVVFILMSILTLPAHAVGEELIAAEALLSSSSNDSTNNSANDDESSDGADNETNDSAAVAETPTVGNLTEKDTVIDTKPEQFNDEAIKKRISGIFSEIDGLGNISVKVSEGVVVLTGEAPNEKKAKQAVNLATRVSEVVAVEDNINRTLDVQDNVTPVLTGLRQQVRGLIKALPLLFVAILVFAIVAWFGGWVARRTSWWQRITPNPFVAELLSQTVKVLFIIIGLILALSLMGAEAIIGTLLGGAGVIGIAVGFAVKDTIENYIASLMLSVRQPFRARDQVDINDHSGIVVRLTSRATILMTVDGNQLRISNSEVFKGTIVNYTKNPERRFTFELGVDANDDPIAAIKVGLDAVNSLDFVLSEPKAIAIITEVGDSNIVLEFQVWVNQAKSDFFKARSIAIRETKHALENNGFSLPEPIYRLRFNGDVEESIKLLNKGDSTPKSSAGDGLGITITSDMQDTTLDTPSGSALQDSEQKTSIEDNDDKLKAKERARQILGDQEAEDVLDARPDPKIMEKVEEEIRDNSGDKDLLNYNSPQE